MNMEIPEDVIDPKELSKLLKVNLEFFKKEISDHINQELKRFAIECNSIRNQGQVV